MSLSLNRPCADSLSASSPRRHGATLLYAFAILAAFCSMGANYGSYSGRMHQSANSVRSEHFIVSAPTADFARQVCVAAEKYRRELAIEWLGQELPPWRSICPIRVIVGQNLGAGGATSFTFANGQPGDWEMEIQGSAQRILDSVLPHEITHTIMATHFGRPLPRWADEGAATSVEHSSERHKQDKLLIEFLSTRRGIAFNEMFAMKEYPRDILPLYSQGYSLARYLIARGGKRKFIDYLADGITWNNWTAATKKHYDMETLSVLQLTWLDWVRHGSPAITADTAIASSTHAPATPIPSREQPSSGATANGLVPLPGRVAAANHTARPAPTAMTNNGDRHAAPSDGWYSRRRDEATREPTGTSSSPTETGSRQRVGRPKDTVLR